MSIGQSVIQMASARPDVTTELMARTGLNEAILSRLVHRFYDLVRVDPLLGPVFAERIQNWEPHLARMVSFWSSVALMTGSYHGTPMAKHLTLVVDASHFDRWLALFRTTAQEVCPPAGADWVIEKAERIAGSIQMNIQDARRGFGHADLPPRL
jgi:hemoglobin